jgi:hypothetical protein
MDVQEITSPAARPAFSAGWRCDMTFYSYTIVVDEDEMTTLENALLHYRGVCEQEIANGNFVLKTDLEHIERIYSRRFKQVHGLPEEGEEDM